ncbi:MAG: cell division protein [Rikenellaceae bacterium]|nr:cell division protein [Rikenellaceae bacterium]
MRPDLLKRYLAVALSFAGSAILLFSCGAKNTTSSQPTNLENLMTEYSENLTIVMSENGQKSYHFITPLMEGYSMAREPYKEFRKGIKIITYEGDTTAVESATLTANYAIFYETRKLWEAKGDVVVIQNGGRRLYTSQLFWNQATHRIYSNVDSRVVDGDELYDCEGFESDEEMNDWHYRKIKGVTYFTEPEPKSEADSLSDADAETAKKPEPEAKPRTTVKPQTTSKPKTVSKPKVAAKPKTPAKPVKPLVEANSQAEGAPLAKDSLRKTRLPAAKNAGKELLSIGLEDEASGALKK